MRKSFASDNWAGVLPEIMAAIAAANTEIAHTHAYGDDPYSIAALARFREAFGAPVEVYYVFNGTGANIVALQSLLRPFEGIICAQKAHLDADECGAPERILGSKLITLPTPDGKLTPEIVQQAYIRIGDQHASQPRVISITQPTELGTVYSPAEIRALADFAHARNMYLHVDGARICNAVASLQSSFQAVITDTEVDILSFGGTKIGLMYGEAIVVMPRLAESVRHALPYIRKQTMQLASKMRFVAAQFAALLSDDLWRRTALHANAMAQRLANGAAQVPAVRINQQVQANGIFASLPPEWVEPLQQIAEFYVWDETKDEVRWMTAWDTQPEEVDAFLETLAKMAQ